MRGRDECSGGFGITPFSGQHKIWKCEHYVYCPLCGWRCDDVADLKKHLQGITSEGKMYCEGWFYFGCHGADQVLNEIKFYELKQKLTGGNETWRKLCKECQSWKKETLAKRKEKEQEFVKALKEDWTAYHNSAGNDGMIYSHKHIMDIIDKHAKKLLEDE